MSDEMFVVFDLETTGLSKKEDVILEVGAIYIDFETLEEKASFSAVVKGLDYQGKMDHVVRKMHTDNGLLADVEANGLDLPWVEQKLCVWLQEQGALANKVILCGNSIQFDRGFIDEQMGSRIQDYLSHRMCDVRSLMYAAEKWLGSQTVIPGGMRHRALDDCRTSLETLRQIRHELKALKALEPP